jgi:thiamine-phosphate pyrophosphorylase
MKLPRVYPILDVAALAAQGIGVLEAAQALVDGGAQILQVRHKLQWSRQMFDSAHAVAELCRKAGTLFIVNDRADIARLLNAGVHVGQDDLEPADVRRVLGSKAVVGYSTHNIEQVEQAAKKSITYCAIGPIFATQSKQDPDPVVGLEALASARQKMRKPLVAIGGITLERAVETWNAGADSVAVIAALYPPNCTPTSIRERMEEWQRLTQS